MNVRSIARIGGQALTIGALVRELRRARQEGDRLLLLDAVVNILAVATTIVIIIREIHRRSEHGSDEDLL
jgi:hypothetical protein